MAFQRLQHGGGAVDTTLNASIGSTDATIALDATTGWPDGSGGPFYLVIGRGLGTEEKVLVTSRSGNTLAGCTRGVDGSSASAHASGEVVGHIFTAVEADEANRLVAQTLGAVTTKGDLTPASGGGAFTRLAAGADGLPLLAASSQPGGLGYATLTSAGLAAQAVTTAKLATGAVTANELAANAVTSAAIADGTVAGTDLAAGTVTGTNLAAGTVTSANLADGTIATADLGDGQITSAKVADATLVPADVAPGGLGGVKSAAVTGGPVGGSAVTLATVTIGAQPFAYTLICTAHWSATNSNVNDTFSFSVKVDGTTKGQVQHRHAGGANEDRNYAITGTTPVSIAASTAATVTAASIREGGSGNLSSSQPGVLTAWLFVKDPV